MGGDGRLSSQTARRDYYEVLGVARDAGAGEIKDAFRRLALRYHPDRSTEADAEQRFKEIAEAYAVLSDPAKRSEYDAAGFPGVAGFAPEDLFAGIDFADLFGGLGAPLGGDRLFERLFGPRRPAGPRRGDDVQVDLVVPLERIASGGAEVVQVRRPAACGACGGSGARPGTSPSPCERCRGTGRLVEVRREPGVALQQVTDCPVCAGRGRVIDEPCPTCAGRGRVEREETLRVVVPAGIEEGAALRLPGRGLESPERDGRAGDLYVVVRTAPDERFERRGADLWRDESIGVADATLGTRRRVPTLETPVRLRVAAGTQPGTIVRLRGHGLPRRDRPGRGDLYVRFDVRVPESLSAEERELYERLRELGAHERRTSAPSRVPGRPDPAVGEKADGDAPRTGILRRLRRRRPDGRRER